MSTVATGESDECAIRYDAVEPGNRRKRRDGHRVSTRIRSGALLVFGPRAGFSYLVTEDARNVLRGSVGRLHEAVSARDRASSSGGPSRGSTQIIQFDSDGDGIWETEYVFPATAEQVDPSIEFDPDLTQPHVDEYILGFRKQFPGLVALDTALIRRRNANI